MEEHHYLVVGSGAAGPILAARLTEKGSASAGKPPTVCVFEAGPHGDNIFSKIPAAFSKNLSNSSLMWQFSSEPTEQLKGRSVYLPQGKLLGARLL